MDIKTIMQDERKKKVLIIVSVALLAIIGLIFFLTRTGGSPEDDNKQLLSDIASLAPRDGTLDRNFQKATAIALSTDRPAITPGESATVSWTSSNTESCTDNNGDPLDLNGKLTVSPTAPYTFDITCNGPEGAVMQSVAIMVTTAPYISLSASPSSVLSGKPSTISWSSINTDRCVDSTGKQLRLSGSFSISPKTPYTFNMSCTGPKGSTKGSITVTIATPPPPAVAQPGTPTTITPTPGTPTTISTKPRTPTTITPTPRTPTTISATRRTGTTSGISTTTGTGRASIALSASSLSVRYGESSTISFATRNATNCYVTTPNGVEILSNTPGNASLILHPGDKYPAPPLTLPVEGSVRAKVLSGQSSATLTYHCSDSAGNNTERSITINGLPPAPDLCKTYGRPTFILSPSALSVPAGGTSDVSWNAKCATNCTAKADPYGDAIEYTDTSTITDYNADADYNVYKPIHNLTVGVNANGAVRVYPGTSDPNPLFPDPTSSCDGDGFCGGWSFAPQSSTVTVKCTNEAGDTPYSTTDSVTVSIIPAGGSCSTLLCDVVDFIGGFGDALGW